MGSMAYRGSLTPKNYLQSNKSHWSTVCDCLCLSLKSKSMAYVCLCLKLNVQYVTVCVSVSEYIVSDVYVYLCLLLYI